MTAETRAVLVDLDGTVALMGKGQPGRRGPYDWERVGEDDPNTPVIELVQILRRAGFHIVFLSGRDASCRTATDSWLLHHGVGGPDDGLLMRPAGDNRADEVVKRELYEKWIGSGMRVAYVIDDRNKVVRMWRDLGLTVLQCADGDF